MRWRAAACLGAFAVGISAGGLPWAGLLAFVALWMIGAALLRAPHEPAIRLILAACVLAGGIAARLAAPAAYPSPLLPRLEGARAQAWGEVEGFVDADAAGSTALVRIRALRMAAQEWIPVRMGATVHFPGTRSPAAGATVDFTARFKGVRNFGVPGEYDRVSRENRRGVFLDAWAEPHWRTVREPEAFTRFMSAVRARALGAAEHHLSAESFGVFAGLAFGEQRRMSADLRAAWRDAGVSHLVAISGLHLAIVFMVVRRLLRWLFSRSETLLLRIDVPFWSGAAALPAVGFYAAISGMQAPTLRSLAMVVTVFVAQALGRRAGALDALCWGTLGLLALEPAWLYHPGFELSFAAVFGAIAWESTQRAEPDTRFAMRALRYLKGALLSTVVATLWTAPLAAFHFGRMSPAGLLANLPLIPFVSLVLTPAAFAYAMGAALAPAFAWPWLPLDLGLRLTNFTVKAFAAAPYAGLDFRFDLLETALFMAGIALAGLWVASPHRRWRRRAAAALALAAVVAAAHEWRRAQAYAGPLRIDVLAIGQGDAVLVSAAGRHMLIDTGDGRAYRRLLRPFFIAERIGRLDALVLTHPHEDHVGSAAQIIAELRPAQVVVPSLQHFADARPDIMAAARKAGVPLVEWTANETHPWSATTLRVLHPQAAFRAGFPLRGGNWNDLSLVLQVESGSECALLPGDAERAAETALVASGALRRCAFLKAPHHGSRTSSAPELLRAVSPQSVYVSSGFRNSFHHPHPSTTHRFEAFGAAWSNTAEAGTLTWRAEANRAESPTFTGLVRLLPEQLTGFW